jgi:hypothetical protein
MEKSAARGGVRALRYNFVRRMSRKITIVRVVLLILAVVIGTGVLYCIWMVFIPHRGTVNSVPMLQKVYGKVGGPIASTFTNSLIQQFPFDGPIDWKIIFFKEPMVFLNGRVDTNALHKFVSDNPAGQISWSGVDTNGRDWSADSWPSASDYPAVTWKTISFGTLHDGRPSVIDGTVDLQSCKVLIISH